MEKAMMKSVMVIGVTMIALLANAYAGDGVCEIVNPSFEDDGSISETQIETTEPNGWQVNLPAGKFRAYVYTDWPTEGRFNLTLYSQWFVAFSAGDAATISQQVDLTKVEQIIFDLKLDTFGFTAWDPNICNAVLMIDSDVVWESNSEGSDVRGEYRDQVYKVEEKYRTEGLHELSLGLRVNVEETLWERYVTHWDFVDCNLFCGGGGILAGDINRDCYVDMNDLQLLAEAWVAEVDPSAGTNLFRDDDLAGLGTINFFDFAVLADGWVGGLADVLSLAQSWLLDVDVDDPSNVFHEDDVEAGGVINFFDFAVLADAWLDSSYVQQE
jgi:hypothetical protein